ncbi:MAG: hypothetical protein HZC55_01505 [Verrucomicrobia bacterium]|nr:hypothetical protein [Verrucomicrobiota bacterium]
MILLRHPATLSRHRPGWVWTFLALIPLVYIGGCIVEASRNIAFQDELDTAIDLLLRLDAGAGWRETVDRLFALSNEHRTVTSRLLFAGSYWLTGTVNFHVIGAIGNAFIVAAGLILVAAAGTTPRRIRLGVVLAFLIFHLGNFENFLWSGASIDHFQVVMLAVGAIALLARDTRRSTIGAAVLAGLATFTLAHGSVVWIVGAARLAVDRRWHRLAGWGAAAALALGIFLHGFGANPGHHIPPLSVASGLRFGHYWLTLVGVPFAFGRTAIAPAFGVVYLALLGLLLWRGGLARERVALPVILFALGSLGLIAYGRAEYAGGQVASRYIVLSCLAWALALFVLLEKASPPGRPYRALAWSLPALIAFNFCSNLEFELPAERFVEARDRAALRFKQYESDGRGQIRLHPKDGHADALLREAAVRGIYELPRLCFEIDPPAATPSRHMIAYVDENMVTRSAISLGGWAMLPGHESDRGEIQVLFRSKNRTCAFTTITVMRTDVAQAYKEPRWRNCGFRLVILRHRLPIDDYQVGLVINRGGQAEFVMTDQWVRLANPVPGEPVRFNTL